MTYLCSLLLRPPIFYCFQSSDPLPLLLPLNRSDKCKVCSSQTKPHMKQYPLYMWVPLSSISQRLHSRILSCIPYTNWTRVPNNSKGRFFLKITLTHTPRSNMSLFETRKVNPQSLSFGSLIYFFLHSISILYLSSHVTALVISFLHTTPSLQIVIIYLFLEISGGWGVSVTTVITLFTTMLNPRSLV